MSKLITLILICLFISLRITYADEECDTQSDLKVGLIKNSFIDYEHYFYYELGKFAQKENINFQLSFIENDIDKYDIIFGEWHELSKLSLHKISLPNKIISFYKNNGIEINDNVFPLDLDTFIILSKKDYGIKSLEEISNFISPIKYTFGMSFNQKIDLLKLISFSSRQVSLDLDSQIIESNLNSFKKLFGKMNKNILDANFVEIYNSYESKDNIFTLFSDGVILYKNLEESYFDLFPQLEYEWDDKSGLYKKSSTQIPYSFYGLSAYIYNKKQMGFLCHLIDNEVRINTFKNFNLQISPLSIHELENFEYIKDEYKKILAVKNQNIIDINKINIQNNYSATEDIIFGKKKYDEVIKTNNYLN